MKIKIVTKIHFQVFLVFTINTTVIYNAYAQPALGTTSFATGSSIVLAATAPCASGRSGTSAGYLFTVYSGADCAIINATGGGSDGHINLTTTPAVTGIWQEGRVASDDGSEFQLDNFIFSVLTAPFVGKTITVNGYRNGVFVSGATIVSPLITTTGLATTYTVDVSADPDFDNIDEFRLSPSGTDAQGTLSIQSITISGALPVQWIHFEAIRSTGTTILLSWQTASELNNKGFEIQQSDDGIHFKTISFLEGKGNSNEKNNYQLSVNSSQNYYYRLRQIDWNGKDSYSKIIYVEGLRSAIKISPNPVQDKIVLTRVNDLVYEIRLVDLFGNLVWIQHGDIGKIENDLNQFLPQLSQGVYLLHFLEQGGNLQIHHFIKSD